MAYLNKSPCIINTFLCTSTLSEHSYLRCPQGGGDPTSFFRCQPQQPVASGYPSPPFDPQASRYLLQQPVTPASGYLQSPYGREYSPQQPMPFPKYPPPCSSSYGSGYLAMNVPLASPFQGK